MMLFKKKKKLRENKQNKLLMIMLYFQWCKGVSIGVALVTPKIKKAKKKIKNNQRFVS